MSVLIPVALLLAGLLGGWFAHARLTLHYKQLWKQAVGQLEDRSLWGDGDQASYPDFVRTAAAPPKQLAAAADDIPYVHGQWALYEKHTKDGAAVYQAVRLGFDPVLLGRTSNYRKFGALYRRDLEAAVEEINEMNTKRERR